MAVGTEAELAADNPIRRALRETGTLPAGTIRSGQELLLIPSLRPARIRGIESLNEPVGSVTGSLT